MRSRRAARGPGLRTRVAVALLVLGAASALSFLGGLAYHGSIRAALLGTARAGSTNDALSTLLEAPGNLARAISNPESLERIHIDIKFRHFTTLQQKRSEALERGTLMASNDDFVPASIRHGERTVRVRVRLKGDAVDHLAGDKWSLRVRTRRGDQLFGLRRFSIQAPATRGFQAEPLVLAHLRAEGVLAPRYFFVRATVNGKDIGVMAVEEHFSKELLESQQRRESVIVRFDEDSFWRSRMLNGTFGPYSNPLVATIQPFGSSKIAKSEKLSAQLSLATGLLRGFADGVLPASQAFDVELLARFLAVAEVWNARHLLAWHNLRFYFNPITVRLEPIGFDANLQSRSRERGLASRAAFLGSRALDDPELRAAFVRSLQRIATGMADGSTEGWVRAMEGPLLRALHREYPVLRPVDLRPLVARARRLERISEESFAHYEPPFGDPDLVYPEPLRAYLVQETEEDPYLELVNAAPVPVTVTTLDLLVTSPRGGALDPAPLGRPPIVLPATEYMQAPSPLRIPLERAPNGASLQVRGTARVAGQDQLHAFVATPYAAPRSRRPVPSSSLDSALRSHSFLRWDEASGELRALPGSWEVGGSLVLPDGVGLQLEAGTTLRFGPGELLLASGPLRFSGTPERPVVLEGRREPDPAGGWAGVVVLESAEPFSWEHVVVRGTAGVDRNGWTLTGGVTLRASDVTLSDTRFEGSRAEDALNLVRSSFVLRRVSFRDAVSDALDVDFSNGTIEGGRYAEIGGDGIDVSGARVVVEDVALEGIHDKALSVGEGSELVARRLTIERVGTAAASKDSSRLVFEDSTLSEVVHAGVMAYQKKAEYGPAEAEARNLVMRGVGRPAVAQLGSRVVIDDQEVEAENVDVDALYQTGFMRK